MTATEGRYDEKGYRSSLMMNLRSRSQHGCRESAGIASSVLRFKSWTKLVSIFCVLEKSHIRSREETSL